MTCLSQISSPSLLYEHFNINMSLSGHLHLIFYILLYTSYASIYLSLYPYLCLSLSHTLSLPPYYPLFFRLLLLSCSFSSFPFSSLSFSASFSSTFLPSPSFPSALHCLPFLLLP